MNRSVLTWALLSVLGLCFSFAVARGIYHEFGLNEPLIQAASHGNLSEIERLVSMGADINYQAGPDSATALIITADDGQVDCVAWLLLHGADPSLKDSSGRTALDRATAAPIRRLLIAAAMTKVGH